MKFRATLLTAALTCLPALVSADVVTDWNDALLDAVRSARTNPPAMTRTMAVMNVAMFDAVNAVDATFEPYHVTSAPPGAVAADVAAAAAARRVLSNAYASMVETFDALFAEHYGESTAPVAERDGGVVWGESVADAILALRADDGAGNIVAYAPAVGAFWWTPTPPALAPALLPQWPNCTPWTMGSGSQFRAPGPPATPSDPRYSRDYEEVRRLGDADSVQRTADQSEIALFWNDGAGTNTPPGHWNDIAQQLAEERDLSLLDATRLFALVSLTAADAAIVAWDNKYHFHHWRPYSAIVTGDLDGNPATRQDATWSSLIVTPPFPSYTSGHSTFSGSAARVLALFLGADDIPFSAGSDGTPGVMRSFDSLSQAAEEAGQSRIYGGIHWQYDNRDAIAAGRALAEYVFANFLRPAGEESDGCTPSDTRLCLDDGRFAVTVDWRVGQEGPVGDGRAIHRTEESGEFWFFEPDNVELVVKVLRGCDVNDKFWVFTAAATNVEYVVKVTDHQAGRTKTYFNPLFTPGRATSDVDAFTCP